MKILREKPEKKVMTINSTSISVHKRKITYVTGIMIWVFPFVHEMASTFLVPKFSDRFVFVEESFDDLSFYGFILLMLILYFRIIPVKRINWWKEACIGGSIIMAIPLILDVLYYITITKETGDSGAYLITTYFLCPIWAIITRYLLITSSLVPKAVNVGNSDA